MNKAIRWLRRPVFWLPLIAWIGVTPLMHWLMPLMPVQRIDVARLAPLPAPSEDADLPVPVRPLFAALSADRNTACTAVETTYRGPNVVIDGPFRVWDLDRQELLLEVNDEHAWAVDRAASSTALHGDWLVLRCNGEVDFYHIPARSKSARIQASQYIVSPSNRYVAYADGELHVLDLETKTTRDIKIPLDEKGTPVQIEICALSDDGELLAAAHDNSILVFATAIRKEISRHKFTTIDRPGAPKVLFGIGPQGRSLAWSSYGTVGAIDLEGKSPVLRVSEAWLLSWGASGRILLERFGPDGSLRQLELCGIASQVAAWSPPPYSTGFSEALNPWRGPANSWIVPSADGRRILLARMIQDDREPLVWMAKVRGWLRIAEPSRVYMEVRVLDGGTLQEIANWAIPRTEATTAPYYFQFAFAHGGDHLFISDSTIIEQWSIPPRSWVKSGLRAGGLTLALLAMAALWRFWRRRKCDTISPSAPPMKPS